MPPKLSDILPHFPTEGPPFPSGLTPEWHWKKIIEEPPNSLPNEALAEKKEEWKKRYSPEQIDMGLKWARNYTDKMIASPLFEAIENEKTKDDLTNSLYSYTINNVEKWLKAVSKFREEVIKSGQDSQ